jgi:hypothetical protein
MSLSRLVDELIQAVKSHQPDNDRINEIRGLDASIGAECLKRGLTFRVAEDSKYLEPFGQTLIPHCQVWPVAKGGKRVGPLRYVFFATDNWTQAMRALAMLDTRSESAKRRGRPKGTKGATRKGIEQKIADGDFDGDIAAYFDVEPEYVAKIRRELSADTNSTTR